jgi:hypothetical protein
MNPAEALHLGCIEKIDEPAVPFPVNADVVVERVAKDLG